MSFDELILAADRAVHAHLGGKAVTYQPSEGEAVVVQGLVDTDFTLFTSEGEIRGPSVFLRLEDLPVHPDDDDPTITIAGDDKEYQVRARQLDGLGGIRLVLSW